MAIMDWMGYTFELVDHWSTRDVGCGLPILRWMVGGVHLEFNSRSVVVVHLATELGHNDAPMAT